MSACTHGMPSPAACIDCMAEGNLEAPPLPRSHARIGASMRAKYEGECPSCSLPIHVGHVIQRWTDDRYRHAPVQASASTRGCTP